MNDVEVKVERGIKELVIREGKANDIPLPRRVELSGNIFAPSQYLSKRERMKESDIVQSSHVIVDKRNNTITLFVEEENHYGHKITGTLNVNPDLLVFGINNENALNGLKSLLRILRFNRVFFSDPLAHEKLIMALSNFKGTVTTDFELTDDRRGNSKVLIDKKNNVQIPFGFKLTMPVYEGFEAIEFFVDILMEQSDVETRFYFESTELRQYMIVQRDKIFLDVVKGFEGFVVIEK